MIKKYFFLILILFSFKSYSKNDLCQLSFASKSSVDKEKLIVFDEMSSVHKIYKNRIPHEDKDILNFFKVGKETFCLKTGRFNNSYYPKIVLYNVSSKTPLFIVDRYNKIKSRMVIFADDSGTVYALFGDNGGNLVTLNVSEGKIHSAINYTGQFNVTPLVFKKDGSFFAVAGVTGSRLVARDKFPLIIINPIENLSAYPMLDPFKYKLIQKIENIGEVISMKKVFMPFGIQRVRIVTRENVFIIDPVIRKIISTTKNKYAL